MSLDFNAIGAAIRWPGWNDTTRAQFANLWHLSRTALPKGSSHDRQIWAAQAFADEHGIPRLAAYKELDRQSAWRRM